MQDVEEEGNRFRGGYDGRDDEPCNRCRKGCLQQPTKPGENQISALPHLLGLRLKKNMESHGTVLLVPTSEATLHTKSKRTFTLAFNQV